MNKQYKIIEKIVKIINELCEAKDLLTREKSELYLRTKLKI